MTKGNILWVDDEIDLLRPNILLLEGRGYTIRTALSGEDALVIASEIPVDLVFLYGNVPGMGGVEALYRLKAVLPETPVVMATKSEEEDLMEQAIGKKISVY